MLKTQFDTQLKINATKMSPDFFGDIPRKLQKFHGNSTKIRGIFVGASIESPHILKCSHAFFSDFQERFQILSPKNKQNDASLDSNHFYYTSIYNIYILS